MLELADNSEEHLSGHLDICKLASMTAFTFENILALNPNIETFPENTRVPNSDVDNMILNKVNHSLWSRELLCG